MLIRRIQIKSFRGLKDLEINFSQPAHKYFKNMSLSILVGENGMGKSS
ncbi:AAA family ATPase [Priestia aryabhattai]